MERPRAVPAGTGGRQAEIALNRITRDRQAEAAGVSRETLTETRGTLQPGLELMKLQQVSDNCFAALNEKNRVCDANSGLINLGGGVVIDTQADLHHARRMIELFFTVSLVYGWHPLIEGSKRLQGEK
jgi:hypothetical protein